MSKSQEKRLAVQRKAMTEREKAFKEAKQNARIKQVGEFDGCSLDDAVSIGFNAGIEQGRKERDAELRGKVGERHRLLQHQYMHGPADPHIVPWQDACRWFLSLIPKEDKP